MVAYDLAMVSLCFCYVLTKAPTAYMARWLLEHCTEEQQHKTGLKIVTELPEQVIPIPHAKVGKIAFGRLCAEKAGVRQG